jgi:hypothetical protein
LQDISIREILNNYFLRRGRNEYKTTILGDKWGNINCDEIKNVFYLLNMNTELIDSKKKIKKLIDELNDMIKLYEKIYTKSDLNKVTIEKSRLEKVLNNFKVSEEYSIKENESNEINLAIKNKDNERFLLIAKAKRIKDILSETIDISAEDIEFMYKEAKFVFDQKSKKH